MNNECLSFSSLEEGQVVAQPQERLGVLGERRTTSIWSGLRTGYQSPSFRHIFLAFLLCVGHSP